MLQDIIDELAKGTYSSDDETAVAELKANGIVTQGPVGAGIVMTKLASFSKLTVVEDIAANGISVDGATAEQLLALQNAAIATVKTIDGRTEFEFQKEEVQQMCNAFVAFGILTLEEKEQLEVEGQTHKFANTTLKLVRQARGKTNIESVGNWTASKRKLKITVDGAVFERLQPTITYADNDYTAAPIRRVVEVGNPVAGTYIVKLDNLRPSGVGTITVELGAPNSFTLELG